MDGWPSRTCEDFLMLSNLINRVSFKFNINRKEYLCIIRLVRKTRGFSKYA